MGFSNSAKAWQGSYGDKSVVSFAVVHGDVHGRQDFECPSSCVPCWVGGIRKDTGLPTRIVHTIGRTNPGLTLCPAPRVLPVLFLCPSANLNVLQMYKVGGWRSPGWDCGRPACSVGVSPTSLTLILAIKACLGQNPRS